MYPAHPAASSAGVTAAGSSGEAGSSSGAAPSSLQPSAAAPSSPTAGTAAVPPAITPLAIDATGRDNPAGLPPAEVSKLIAGGPPGELSWVYPYDGTVFPGGLMAPLVMWTGNDAPDAVYLHIRSQAFEYRGVHKPSLGDALFLPDDATLAATVSNGSALLSPEPNHQLAIPQAVWDAASQRSLGKADPLRMEITERVNGAIHGPVGVEVTIARGALQGSIYYNICFANGQSSDPIADALGIGARVVRIPARGNAEVLSDTSECVGCHTVAANGSRMVAQQALYPADLSAPVRAWSAPLGVDGKPAADRIAKWGSMGSFGALYPDGSKYLAASGNAGLEVDANGVVPLTAAALFDAVTGELIPDTGIPVTASMPNFSPDGTHLVFNDTSLNDSRGLVVMDYDTRANKARGYRVLLENAQPGSTRPGWPFFLPDNRAVVFVQTSSPDFTSGQSHIHTYLQLQQAAMYPSDLYIADAATGTQTLLARAMGFDTPERAAADETYQHYGKEQLHRNYFPTVSPVASGGYFWIFFGSLRHFGSIGAVHSLWGAAVDIHPDGSYTADPSHPAFYVPGQELISTSHHRAFAALNACKPDAARCETGVDCCSGRCTAGQCAQPPADTRTCARRDERCATAADCCDKADYCINNFCAFVELL